MSKETAMPASETPLASPPPTTLTTPLVTTSTEPTSETATESENPSAAAEPLADLAKLELPEGFTLAEKDREELAQFVTSHKISQAALADLAKFYTSRLTATAETLNAEIEASWKTTNEKWRTDTLSLFNGDESAATAESSKFQPIINRFGGDELREALATTGAGNHPAVFKFFQQITAALGEGTPVAAQAAAKGGEDPLRAFYKNSPQLFKE